MNKAERTAWIAIPIVLLLAAGVAWAGSQGSAQVAGFPLFALAVVLAFLIRGLSLSPLFSNIRRNSSISQAASPI